MVRGWEKAGVLKGKLKAGCVAVKCAGARVQALWAVLGSVG